MTDVHIAYSMLNIFVTVSTNKEITVDRLVSSKK